MTENKKTVIKYMHGFCEGNHEKIISCLAENVIWDMPGIFHWQGKESIRN